MNFIRDIYLFSTWSLLLKRVVDVKYLGCAKILLSHCGEQNFWLFWGECNVLPIDRINIFHLQISKHIACNFLGQMIIATNMNSTNVINRGRNANISHSFIFMGQIRTYVKMLSKPYISLVEDPTFVTW